jgi:hypothetical protein
LSPLNLADFTQYRFHTNASHLLHHQSQDARAAY